MTASVLSHKSRTGLTRARQRAFAVLAAALLLYGFASAPASAEPGPKKMVVILADHTSLSDWMMPGLPHLDAAMKQGALGLMVVRIGGAEKKRAGAPQAVPDTLYTTDIKRRTAAHLSLGAGLPAVQNENARLAFFVDEVFAGNPVSKQFRAVTGRPAPETGIVNLGLAAAPDVDDSDWEARPGALGGLLQKHGVRVAVVGNSDCRSRVMRLGTLLAADPSGVVPRGNIGDAVRRGMPGTKGCCTSNRERLFFEFQVFYARSDFVVLEFGDAACADQKHIGDEITDPVPHYMAAPMKRFDRLVGDVLSHVDLKTTQVILLSPTPTTRAFAARRALTPILVLGRDAPGDSSMLSSLSTKQPGLVVNLDFAVHVCRYFGLDPVRDFIGSDFAGVKTGSPRDFLKAYEDRDAFVESHGYLLRRSVVWHTVLIVLCLLVLYRAPEMTPGLRRALNALLLFTMGLFLAFLLIAALPGLQTEASFFGVLFALCAGLALGAGAPRDASRRLMLVCGLYTAALVLDQVLGGPLIKHSVMGYFPQRGARFYGLGNEYAGLLMSAPVLLYGLLLDAGGNRQAVVRGRFLPVFAVIVLVCASPFWGANFGATLSCTAAFVIMAWLVHGGRFRWVHGPLALVALALAAGAMVLLDAVLPMGDSHVGHLVQRVVHGGGMDEVFKIAFRKLAVNLRLIRVPAWSSLFFLNMILCAVFLFRPPERVAAVFRRLPHVRKALAAVALGAVVALLVNDSGLITGATATALPVLAVFLMAFQYGFPRRP